MEGTFCSYASAYCFSYKTSLSILTQTSGQFEETTKQFIEQQQLQREEAQKQLEGFWKSSSQNSWNSQKFEENSKIYLLPSSKKNVGANRSTNKTLSSSYYIKMANIFRYGKEGGQNESISRSTNCSGASL